MRKIAVIVLLVTLSLATIAQKTKFGHINQDSIFDAMPEKAQITKALEEYGRTLENQMLELQKEYETKITEYQANMNTWSPAIKEIKEEEIYSMQQRIQNFQQKAQRDIVAKENELLEPIYDKIEKAIKLVGEEKNLIYVFNSAALLYISSESVDITKDVKIKLGIK